MAKAKKKLNTEEENETPEKEISADQLFKEFREVQLSEFFRKNKQYLGYIGKIKSLTTVVHELVTNSLDACEEAGILPDLKVKISQVGEDKEHFIVEVEDNGPGIPEKNVEKVFGQLLTGTKFHRNIQLRGQQGLGVSGAVLFTQITTGKPTYVKTGTASGKVVELKIMMDIKTNAPKVMDKNIQNANWRGTLVRGEYKGVQYTKGQRGPFEYIRWTAASNPHAKIIFKDPEGEAINFNRVTKTIPQRPSETKPHPAGAETHDLLEIAHKTGSHKVSSFLVSEFSRVSADKVAEIQKLVNFDLRISPKKLEWAQAEQLVNAFRKIKWMAPPAAGLIPMGEKTIEKALANLLQPEFVMARTRDPCVYKGGIPFLVEVAVAYGGDAGRETAEGRKTELMRFANRAPLLFDAGACVTTEAMNSIDWKRYHVQDLENAPLTIFVNVISTHVPYTSTGKQSIAEEEELYNEIRFALMQILRDLQIFLSGKRKIAERAEKKKIFEKYIPETSKALSRITGEKEDALIKKLEQIVLGRFGKDFSKETKEEEEEEEEVGEEE